MKSLKKLDIFKCFGVKIGWKVIIKGQNLYKNLKLNCQKQLVFYIK